MRNSSVSVIFRNLLVILILLILVDKIVTGIEIIEQNFVERLENGTKWENHDLNQNLEK